uniref:SFRICE_012541 n=1 Tax=Spodoptera frugiperda TaxID=7108 RepID=A0A2H1WFJ5_SPOFR
MGGGDCLPSVNLLCLMMVIIVASSSLFYYERGMSSNDFSHPGRGERECQTFNHQESFHYLNQGGSPNIDGVDDLRTFNETRSALTTLGVTETEQDDMFRILATILHLGNVELLACDPDAPPTQDTDDGAYINSTDKHLAIVCSLLGISRAELSRWLTHRRIASAHETILYTMDK